MVERPNPSRTESGIEKALPIPGDAGIAFTAEHIASWGFISLGPLKPQIVRQPAMVEQGGFLIPPNTAGFAIAGEERFLISHVSWRARGGSKTRTKRQQRIRIMTGGAPMVREQGDRIVYSLDGGEEVVFKAGGSAELAGVNVKCVITPYPSGK